LLYQKIESEGQVRNIFGFFEIIRQVSNAIHQENGELLFTTWYDKGFTEESEFSTYTDAKFNLLNYVEARE